MQYNPIALRAYFWRVAMGCNSRALELRQELQTTGETFPVVGFRPVFDEGREKHHWAQTLTRMHVALMENLDAWVRSCLERPPVCEACRSKR